MRIKEISLQRYGPLPRMTLSMEDGIQPIYGLNESGKTLLIDAILKRLIGGKSGWPENLNRVEEAPEGYIVLEDNGEEIKLEQDETLSDFLEVNPDELRNIFVIRDADLRIEAEDVFYERVQDKIAGLRTTDIRTIQEWLRKRGRLTPGLNIVNSASYDYPQRKLKEAKLLREDIIRYLEKIKDEKIQDLEVEIYSSMSGQTKLQTQLEALEKAMKKDEFEKIENAIASARTSLSELEKIPEERMLSLDGKLILLDEKEGEQPHIERSESQYRRLSYLFGLGSIISIIFYTVVRSVNMWSIVIPLVMLVFLVISLMFWRNNSHNLSELEKSRRSLITQSQRLGLKVDDIGNLREAIGEFKEKNTKNRGELHERIGVIKEHLNIDADSHKELLDIASKELDIKREEIDFDIEIVYDDEEKKRIQESLAEIETRRKKLEKDLSDHYGVLQDFSKRAYQLTFDSFLNRSLELSIETTDSLDELLIELDDFIIVIEEDASISADSIKIFEELEAEEEAEISKLFEEGSPASTIFAEITNQRYSRVVYDPKRKVIMVERPTGKSIEAKRLSRGARDQLYLAIRIALGSKILESRKGFFIMDDAFIAADENRLKTQIELLSDLSERGWQILYFTMKREALDNLREITKNEPIMLETLP